MPSMYTQSIYHKCCKATVHLSHARRSELWMIDVICHVCSESPIVRAILEQIHHWHCRMREPMNEYRFQQTFGIMNCVTGSGDASRSKLISN